MSWGILKSGKKRVYIPILSFCLILITGQLVSSCFTFRMSEKELYERFKATSIQPVLKSYEVLGREIHYVEVGEETAQIVLFVHGAPGSLGELINFLTDSTLAGKARLISTDRPGYGYSGLGEAEISVERQAAMLLPILKTNRSHKLPILVGHSYGGTVIARLAMDYPEYVDALVMAAPAIDPENEKFFWVNRPADSWAIRWMVPRSLKAANDEKLSHVEQLKLMLPYWEKISAPTTIIHGKTDGLVPFANAEFGKKMLKNAQVDMVVKEDIGHLIPWENPDLIRNAVLKYLEQ
jgi:pimeloyl-ACP methyl ester carboxylesterase